MTWIGVLTGFILGLIGGVSLTFALLRPLIGDKVEIKRVRAKKQGKVDISDISTIPSEEKIIKGMINNPESDNKKFKIRLKNRKWFKRKNK